jgi:hypothetical protein
VEGAELLGEGADEGGLRGGGLDRRGRLGQGAGLGAQARA